MSRTVAFSWMVIVMLLSGGCGTSGSRPPRLPEVRFQVHPSGQSSFTAELVTNGVRHTFPAGTVFTATSLFSFVLENASPPYSGTFTLTGGGDLTVTLIIADQSFTASTSGFGTQAVVASAPPTPGITPGPPALEVRFDVCVPSVTPGTCFGAGNSGVFGLPFTGSIGDPIETHLLSGSTPSIYFLEGAEQSVNAVFGLSPRTGDGLMAQLFINGELSQTDSGTQDVVIKQDL